jgi:hypothetical protein
MEIQIHRSSYVKLRSGQTIVRADVTGDMTADPEIHLAGNIALHQSDFLLS